MKTSADSARPSLPVSQPRPPVKRRAGQFTLSALLLGTAGVAVVLGFARLHPVLLGGLMLGVGGVLLILIEELHYVFPRDLSRISLDEGSGLIEPEPLVEVFRCPECHAENRVGRVCWVCAVPPGSPDEMTRLARSWKRAPRESLLTAFMLLLLAGIGMSAIPGLPLILHAMALGLLLPLCLCLPRWVGPCVGLLGTAACVTAIGYVLAALA